MGLSYWVMEYVQHCTHHPRRCGHCLSVSLGGKEAVGQRSGSVMIQDISACTFPECCVLYCVLCVFVWCVKCVLHVCLVYHRLPHWCIHIGTYVRTTVESRQNNEQGISMSVYIELH